MEFEKLEDVPEQIQSVVVEQDGKFILPLLTEDKQKEIESKFTSEINKLKSEANNTKSSLIKQLEQEREQKAELEKKASKADELETSKLSVEEQLLKFQESTAETLNSLNAKLEKAEADKKETALKLETERIFTKSKADIRKVLSEKATIKDPDLLEMVINNSIKVSDGKAVNGDGQEIDPVAYAENLIKSRPVLFASSEGSGSQNAGQNFGTKKGVSPDSLVDENGFINSKQLEKASKEGIKFEG
jgi:hypothetical protein